MIKKIIILASIAAPFLIFYISCYLAKKTKPEWPVIKLSIVSLCLLLSVLVYYRFTNSFPAGQQYTPPKLENGEWLRQKCNRLCTKFLV